MHWEKAFANDYSRFIFSSYNTSAEYWKVESPRMFASDLQLAL